MGTKKLILNDTNVDDDILANVSRFTNLNELVIQGSKVTEASMPLFKTLSKRLGKINIRDNDMRFDEYMFFHLDKDLFLSNNCPRGE